MVTIVTRSAGVRDRPGPLGGQLGNLELAEQVLASRRRPVGPERHRHAMIQRGAEFCRLPVQQQVGERRPDHAAAVIGEHREVRGGEADAMDAHQVRGDRPLARCELQGLEVAPGSRVRPLRQVQDDLLTPGDAGQEMLRIVRVHVGDVRCGRRKVRIGGRLDVADEAAEVLDDAGVGRQRDALARRGPTEQASQLHVADDRGDYLVVAAEHTHRAGDEPVVIRGRRTAPLVPIAVLLRHIPQRQHVVGQVIVQLDQSRVDRSAALRERNGLEAGRRRHPVR